MLQKTLIETKEKVIYNKKSWLILAVLLFLSVAVGVYFFFKFKTLINDDIAKQSLQNDQKINSLEEANQLLLGNLKEANDKIDKLSVKLTQIEEAKTATQNELNLQNNEPLNPPLNPPLNEIQTVALEQDNLLQTAPLGEVSTSTVDNDLEKSKLNNQIKLILAAVKLRDTVNSSKSFEQELKELKFFAQDNENIMQNIAILEKYAEKGVSSAYILLKDFDETANEIINTTYKNKESANFSDKLIFKLSSLVRLRKIEADDYSMRVDDIIARAYKHLQEYDIKNAINELGKLDSDVKDVASNWLANAEAYLDCKDASEEIFFYVSKL